MDADLAEKLSRRIRRIESVESSSETSSTNGNGSSDDIDFSFSLTSYECQRSFESNPPDKCTDFSRKQLHSLRGAFDKYDTDRDKALSFDELKCMMEKLGIPQTHLSLKEMIKEVDKDHDGKISFREFLSLFQKVAVENSDRRDEKSSIIYQLYAMLVEIDVSKEGVDGAKQFFEAKIAAVHESDKFYREIREEQEQRRQLEEEKLRRKLAFQHRRAQFQAM